MLWREQEQRCALCGQVMYLDAADWAGRLTVDHNMPVSRGGRWTRDNIKFMHQMCNTIKGALTINEWVAFAKMVLAHQEAGL